MLDYNVPGGEQMLSDVQICPPTALHLTTILQAYFLVLDDIMDNSHTRRGQLCWFRVPKVEFQTASGQMLDLITTHEGEKDLSKYTMTVCVEKA
ncbi:hypothetical protein GW17_00011572 [Ensete ventricosum]|nr:hypothetical protein GW17_00011572 [Ensete ventricosum]